MNTTLLQEGRWTLDPDESSPKTGTFRPSIDGGYFLATLPMVKSDVVHVEVAVLKGTMWVTMEFYLPHTVQASATESKVSHARH